MILFASQVHMEEEWRGRGVRRQVASTNFQDLWFGRLGTLQQHLLKLDVKGKNRRWWICFSLCGGWDAVGQPSGDIWQAVGYLSLSSQKRADIEIQLVDCFCLGSAYNGKIWFRMVDQRNCNETINISEWTERGVNRDLKRGNPEGVTEVHRVEEFQGRTAHEQMQQNSPIR